MNVDQMKELVAARQWQSLEGAWLEAVEQKAPAPPLAGVLEALVAADQLNTAETLAWTLLAERTAQLPPEEALEVAKAVVTAVPVSDELRSQAAELYRAVHGQKAHFAAMLRASGLTSGQSPRRAFRTLDVCLGIEPAAYMVNRFDHQAYRLETYEDALGEFVLRDPSNHPHHLEPKALADEFDPADETDFRVLCQFCPGELTRLIDEDPASVLIGLCMSGGGEINSANLKDKLVPRYLPAEKWSHWWSRARTAANRCPQLALEGRTPVTIKYHPQGLTLEQEMTPLVAGAFSPLEKLALLQQYVRQAAQRKSPISPPFVAPIMESLASQTQDKRHGRSMALAAALALEKLVAAGLPMPSGTMRSPGQLLAQDDSAAETLVAMDNEELFSPALDAMATRPDAAEQLVRLLAKAPSIHLDDIARRLRQAGRDDAIAAAVASAVTDPLKNLQVCLWLWKGPNPPIEGGPSKTEILVRLLNAALEMERDWDLDPAFRKAALLQIRSALSAGDYASYRQVLGEVSESVAGTLKRRVERCDGLAEAVQGKMLALLKENFFTLFVEAKVAPWLDESVIWTTEAALKRQQDEFTQLTDVKMLANARAIGAAAAHGDLRENADWQFAMEEKRRLLAQATRMQDELTRCRILQQHDVPTDFVGIGSRVTLKRADGGGEQTLTILGPWDGDLTRGLYSYKSALAATLLGKAPGQTVTLKNETGEADWIVGKIEVGLE
ncbi:MAG: GreA/GreB family elongation factor [Phycisphaerae bacterium]|jgi:transcription elongation GreA/GreB family factor